MSERKGAAASVVGVLDVLRGARFLWATEDDLQRGIAAALEAEGAQVEREVRLNARDRIDLLVNDTVGIEVKTAGAWRDVARQLDRYLQSPRITDLILVTCKAQHRRVTERVTAREPGQLLYVHQLELSGL